MVFRFQFLNCHLDVYYGVFIQQDKQQQEQIIYLEHRLDNLTDFVYKLHDEMSDLNKQVRIIQDTTWIFILYTHIIYYT